MEHQPIQDPATKRLTAIVPAYNEAERIDSVLSVLCEFPLFREIIVVDDGSTDATFDVARKWSKARVVKNEFNRGKGFAMDFGVSLAKEDTIFFCDADVRGLSPHIIEEITAPVLRGEVDMFVAMRRRRIYEFAHAILRIIPLLGGERALTKELWRKLPAYYKHAFRVESGLNFYANHFGKGFRYKVFDELTQVIKERKYGFWIGVSERLSMCYDILLAHLYFHLIDAPRIRRRRVARRI
ncbi:MAG: hypothetical protein A2849_02010 [Candidatus Taylorbacteria bacterium RIFCSPHIGHO2_01_FULL_51_15]|uniref:Glycosyltransferase 2-like domain-containing protein n=1 Tax=Candidatus Taylorbacteria bacterium RIFCSPHIGHO2_01_FULL_51_15 TaxID=1802304 RepID=A0A1G2MB00_9BACT|nr:MAG: hypothetical protein A2849_02010 [Candidatus Taylorbacteria bacterium RIFCSPHIGHO2_01_FULL_51_15]